MRIWGKTENIIYEDIGITIILIEPWGTPVIMFSQEPKLQFTRALSCQFV